MTAPMTTDVLPHLEFTTVCLTPVVVQPLGRDGGPRWARDEARTLGNDSGGPTLPAWTWAVYSGASGAHVGYVVKHRRIYWPLYYSTEWGDYCLAVEAKRLRHALNYLVTAWRGVIRRAHTWTHAVNQIASERAYLEDEITANADLVRTYRVRLASAIGDERRRLHDRIDDRQAEIIELETELAGLEDEPTPPRAGRPIGLNRAWWSWERSPHGRLTDEGTPGRLLTPGH